MGTAWTGWLIAAAATAAGGGAGGNRVEVRTLIGVLSLIIGLLVIMMVLVAMSSVRRRLRAVTVDREARRGKRARRRVDPWAEAGRRAVLAPPPDPSEDGEDDSDADTDDGDDTDGTPEERR